MKHCAKHFEAQKSGEVVEYQYGEWLKANGGRSHSPSKRDMGKTDAGGAMDHYNKIDFFQGSKPLKIVLKNLEKNYFKSPIDP